MASTVSRVGRRILLLITDLQIGGTPTVVRELATRLNAPPQVRVDVACLAGDGPVAGQLRGAGVRIFPLNARGAADVGAIVRLARLVRDNQYDSIISFLVHANAAAAVLAPFHGEVRFIQSIQTTQPYPRWHWIVQSIAHHAAERVVVPSPSVAFCAASWADVPATKIVIIPNAVELTDFADPANPPRAESDRSLAIGFIGRLDPIKRLEDLLEATCLLGPDVHLEIFGEGSERARIEDRVGHLGISSQVTLHGAVPRPQEALRRIDVLVLPSMAEGFGLVLIEAMAAGVPVVATDAPGIRDVVRHRQTGLLVPVGSPAKLTRAIDRLRTDQRLRLSLIAQARQQVARLFTWAVVLPQYRQLLSLD